jgi:nicotinate-nucleotide adenylyltransferase
MIDANSILSSMTISERRLKHTLGVAEAAKELAKTHFPALDLKSVELAALMHDYTKEYSIERQFEICEQYGIILTDDEKNNPKLLHAKTAAMIASDRFGMQSDACSAIYWHTTGRPNMSPFEIVIYLADYIEETRTFSDCIELRKYFYENINNAASYEDKLEVLRQTLVLSFDMTIKNLIDDGKIVDFYTMSARNYLIVNENNLKWRK